MVLKRKIFLLIALVVLLATIVLSLKRSDNVQDPSGEIKHFNQATLKKNLRLKNGLTIEDYIEKHIRVGNRVKEISRTSLTTQEKNSPGMIVVQDIPESTTDTFGVDHESETGDHQYEPGKKLIHEVTWGDSFESLAKIYQTTPYQIRKHNHLSKDAMLKIDQKLHIIPVQKSTYRVHPGDTLTGIAQLFDASRQEIEQLNHLDASRPIWVGQKLIMPVDQEKIDTLLAQLEEKKREEARRKKRYQRELLTRIEKQKRVRKREAAKALAQEKARLKKARKAAKARQARINQARHTLKYTGTSRFKHKMRVVATAYTSHRSQTDSTPFLAAWNNRIRPGMKIIAVSPDLIRKYGITNGVRVKIGGLPGTYVVRDKMNRRLHNHIDIYMGTNRRRALRWGRRRVVLYW
jgi:3D (Asp-Asp-Asp) domain-containing protein/LysM repeat protein